MKTRNHHFFVCLICAVTLISSAGCKKSVSINGTWHLDMQYYISSTANQYIFDTTYSASNPTTITFKADGTVMSTAPMPHMPIRGIYTVNGHMLNYFDSTSMISGSLTISQLESRLLILSYNDTISSAPTEFIQKAYGFSR